MDVIMCKSKIHKAKLTQCDLDYEGSLAIDTDLLAEAGMFPYEKILVVNQTNGQRLETYVIPGAAGSGEFCLNGAAARRGEPGDKVTIMSFGAIPEAEAAGFKPKIIVLGDNNRIIERKGILG